MGLQTSVTTLPGAFEGMRGDGLDGGWQADSRIAYASTLPGKLVVWHAGDSDEIVRVPAATGEVSGKNPVGVVICDVLSDANPIAAGSALACLRKGRIWVYPEEAVTPASAVFVRFASGSGGTALGSFRASADTATAVEITKCRWITSGSATVLALLEINL